MHDIRLDRFKSYICPRKVCLDQLQVLIRSSRVRLKRFDAIFDIAESTFDSRES